MKTITFLSLIFTVAILKSQTCEIDFAGAGDTTIVDSVTVENLNQGTTLSLKGEDILELTIVPEVNSLVGNTYSLSSLKVYPNPMTENASIQFEINDGGIYPVTVYDLSGRSILQSAQYLNPGTHTYRVSGLIRGIYLVQVNKGSSAHSAKLISRNSTVNSPAITHVSSGSIPLQHESQVVNQVSSSTEVAGGRKKSTSPAIELTCDEGDVLLFTGMTGNYSTIVTVEPQGDTTINFEFMECKDADDNHYPIVTIGEQTWMAKNLRTTKYNDSTAIPSVTDPQEWIALTSPGYSWFNNDSLTNIDPHGALYNWYAVDTASNGGRNVCPSGWHIPSFQEWHDLSSYLESSAGGKLKVIGTEYWNSPNTGATNESGFSGLGSGWRTGGTGEYLHQGIYTCWWSSSIDISDSSKAWYMELMHDQSSILLYNWYVPCGFSVRCVKD